MLRQKTTIKLACILFMFSLIIPSKAYFKTNDNIEVTPNQKEIKSTYNIKKPSIISVMALTTAIEKIIQNNKTNKNDFNTAGFWESLTSFLSSCDKMLTTHAEKNNNLLTDIADFLNHAPLSHDEIYANNFKYKIAEYSTQKILNSISKRIMNKLSHMIFPNQQDRINRRTFRVITNSISSFLTNLIVLRTIQSAYKENENIYSDAITLGILELTYNIFFEAWGEFISVGAEALSFDQSNEENNDINTPLEDNNSENNNIDVGVNDEKI